VTLAPSVPIYHSCLPTFVITGLTGAATEDNDALALINKPANLVLQTAASWTRVTGRLTVNLTETDQHPMEAGVSYKFSINLTNGIAAQPSPVQIVVDPTLFTGTQNMTGDESVPLSALNIYLPVAGDLLPLYIRTVFWVVRHMGQTSPYRKSALFPATVLLFLWFSSIMPPPSHRMNAQLRGCYLYVHVLCSYEHPILLCGCLFPQLSQCLPFFPRNHSFLLSFCRVQRAPPIR